MIKRAYTILLHADSEEGGYTVTVPALPGCVTQGETLEEAISMAREAIALHIEGLLATGRPVPEGDAGAQAVSIEVESPAA